MGRPPGDLAECLSPRQALRLWEELERRERRQRAFLAESVVRAIAAAQGDEGRRSLERWMGELQREPDTPPEPSPERWQRLRQTLNGGRS